MALEARYASKCHSGPTPGLFRGEAGLPEQFRGGGGGSEGLESRLAGLDEESNSESSEAIKGWPDTFPPGTERVLEFIGAHCVLPQSGRLETEKGGTGATPWIAGPERNELNTNSLESRAKQPQTSHGVTTVSGLRAGVDEGAGTAQSRSKLDTLSRR